MTDAGKMGKRMLHFRPYRPSPFQLPLAAMNNAPLTLILIAAIGLIVVLSLGVFFAVKPGSGASRHKARLLYYGYPPNDTQRPPLPREQGEALDVVYICSGSPKLRRVT